MLERYLTHIAVILLPLLFVQIWVFRKSFYELPWRLSLMALYGAVAAAWAQEYPISVFGISADFGSVPIIISFLYGKRVAGLVSTFLLLMFDLVFPPNPTFSILPVAVRVVLYSVVPFIICTRFETFRHRTRWVIAVGLSFLTVAIQGISYIVGAMFNEPVLFSKLGFVWHFVEVKLLPVSVVVFALQSLMTIIPILLMDNVIEDGKLRMALLDNEHRYQSLVQFNPLGICIFDRHHRFVMANTAYQNITGYTLTELVGRSRFELWYTEELKLAHTLSRTLETGEVFMEVPGTLRHKDGRRIDTHFTNVPIMAHGVITGYFSLVTDVTKALQMEKQLRDSEKLSVVGELAASIAHEIRNPLTSLFGFLKLMQEKLRSRTEVSATVTVPEPALSASATEALSSYVEIMQSELNRINQISGQLLMLGKPQIDYFDGHDLREVIQDVVTLLEPQMNMSNVELSLEIPPSELLIWCDKNQIKQAIINIVKNAIEAMSQRGGRIEIRAARTFQRMELTIKDDGPGIPRKLLARLGEPFYTTKVGGTGLGLLVTKRIVQAHGGTIEIESVPNHGAIVRLAFDAFEPTVATLEPTVDKLEPIVAAEPSSEPMPTVINEG